MKKLLLSLFAFAACAAAGAHASAAAPEPPLLPRPAVVEPGKGFFRMSAATPFLAENAAQAELVRSFATVALGYAPEVATDVPRTPAVCFATDATLAEEGYRLDVAPGGIAVAASTERGLLYALQTLRQLLPADPKTSDPAAEWRVPAVRIADAPRFAYRGLMLDVARYFIPKEHVMKIIDAIAALKINTLHLHLSDDNGWRVEIRRYPRLTEVGAWRVDRPGVPFPARRNARQWEEATVGGYYTQQDIREIVAYASARRIDVIPEIDIPAHSNAALAAYPELACPVVDKYIGVLPGLGGDNARIIYCAGNERVYEFLEHVLDEVMELFPSRRIHLGGDEADKYYWSLCPHCRERMRAEGMTDPEQLQGYFMRRVSDYVRSRGREVCGWDELTNAELPEGAIVYGWQGTGDLALRAARQGHRFVMTPAKVSYLIRYQGPQWFEPETYFGNNTLRGLFDYDPVRPDWDPAWRDLLLGVQASLWTEFCASTADVDHLLFPRTAALAEIGWSQPGRKQWPGFLRALDRYVDRLAGEGIAAARSMYNIQHTVRPVDGRLEVRLMCERPDVAIRCTTDGSEPTFRSSLYTAPLAVFAATTIRCATFRGRERTGEVLTLDLGWNLATAKPVEGAGAEGQLLVNGLQGRRNSDFEWCTRAGELVATVDLLRAKTLRRCTLGALANPGMGIYLPAEVAVELSSDNEHFTEVARLVAPADTLFSDWRGRRDLELDLGGRTARWVRLRARSAGIAPPTAPRPGREAQLCCDEIAVE